MIAAENLRNLPTNPGCYLFKDSSGKIIYIGKAKNLKKRVSSYFKKKDLDPKTSALVGKISSIDFVATDSEVEALILENNLIKKHQPKYNLDLKDSKRYSSILLTSEKFPRLTIARAGRNDAGQLFGPFTSAQDRDYLLKTLCKAFKLRTCRRMPKRACLRFHLGICSAPCVGKISENDYLACVEKAKLVLKGKTKELAKQLESEMKILSKSQRFEEALAVKKQLEALQFLEGHQNAERQRECNEDIINFTVKNGKVHLLVFKIHKGTLSGKQEYSFDYSPDFMEEFLIQYYSDNPAPKEIIAPEKINGAVVSFLEKKSGQQVSIIVPKKGEKKELLDLAAKNIELSFFGGDAKLSSLKNALKLPELPSVIECFDISHTSGTSTVGSMVQFREAKPDKSNYRRFRIRSVEGIDDVASIAEIVNRRYSRLKQEGAKMPNLILIDGGKGQLNSALHELEGLGISIPVAAIAKEFEEIHLPRIEKPLSLDRKSPALLLLREIRDEAHRFAITYHKLLRKKELIGKGSD